MDCQGNGGAVSSHVIEGTILIPKAVVVLIDDKAAHAGFEVTANEV